MWWLWDGWGLCRNNDPRRSTHSLSSIVTPKPKYKGSLTATIALVTVAGETVAFAWNTWVAKLVSTEGIMVLTPLELTKVWKFFHPDSYWRRVDALCACSISSTDEVDNSLLVMTRRINAMRESVVISLKVANSPGIGLSEAEAGSGGVSGGVAETTVELPIVVL